MNPACNPLTCHLSEPITSHPNRFECLLDRNPDMPVVHGKGNPNSNPNPTPQASTSKPRKATKKPQPQTASNRNPPMQKFYIRAVPSHTSIQEVKRKLQSLSVPHDHLSEPYLTAPDSKRKNLEIFLGVDDANKLDKGLKCDATLGWFVSIFAPKRPHPVPLMSLKLPPVPSDHKDKRPVPLMSLKLPPVPSDHKDKRPVPLMSLKLPPVPSDHKDKCPVPLMSLKLPPLPTTYTSCQQKQQSQPQATQDFLGRGKSFLIVR